MKLYDRDIEPDVQNRLFIIGIGENGADCLLQCKHDAENRFGRNNNFIRYLGIGLQNALEKEKCGSFLSEEEKVCIIPEEAIYPYLNNAVPIPENAQSWLDEGLRNYTSTVPKYGLQKRQCGRLALLHCINEVLEKINNVRAAFSESERPLEIAVCGNMGDAFFGGMMIDLGFILNELFSAASYAFKVNSYMFVGDTAKQFISDARDLAHYYANIVVTKTELDKFQCRKKEFSQKYTESFEINTDHQPYSSCFIARAGKDYGETLCEASEKILSAAEILRSKEDEADKIMTYNMLGKGDDHSFRYLTYSVRAKRLPLGKLASYLSCRIFANMAETMRQKYMPDGELSILVSKAVPNAEFLASKAGIVSNPEFNETLNPLFSLKSLKKGGEASLNYILNRINELELLTRQGADIFLPQAFRSITDVCDEARSNPDKGPFYAAGAVRKCINDLESAIKRITAENEEAQEQIRLEEKLVASAYRSVKHTPSFMASNAVAKYISRLTEFSECKEKIVTFGTLTEFYGKMLKKLKGYYEENLDSTVRLFDAMAEIGEKYMKQSDNCEECITDSVDISDPDILADFDKLADSIPETTKTYIQKRTQLLNDSDDETAFARELLNIVNKCGFLAGFLGFFAKESEELAGECADLLLDDKDNSAFLMRIISSAGKRTVLRKKYTELNFIFNGASVNGIAAAIRIDGGIALSDFEDCEQWENMRYAYVNDSLKKHGIHIFKGRR